MRWTDVRIVAAAAVVALLAAACGGGSEIGAARATPSPTTEETASPAAPPVSLSGMVNDHGTKTVAGLDEAEVEVDDFSFAPTFVKAAPGQRIEVELENEGKVAHTFTIDALKIDETLQPGQRMKVEVELPSSEVVNFYCRFHRSQGMQGAFFFKAGGAASVPSTTESDTNY